MNWVALEKRLFVNGQKVEMPEGRAVKEVVEYKGRLYVLLDRMQEPSPTNNIVCVDQFGHLVWQLKPFPFSGKPNPATGLWVEEEKDELWAYFWQGYAVIIDPNTGDWRAAELGARPC